MSNTIMACFKELVGTKSINTKQCPAGLSPRVKPNYPPNHFCEIVWDTKQSHLTIKNLPIFPTRKIPFNKFTSSAIFRFLFNCPIQVSFVSAAIALVSFLLILINLCLLNVVFSMKKAWNGQSSRRQNFYSFHTPFFMSNVIKFQLVPLQLGRCSL